MVDGPVKLSAYGGITDGKPYKLIGETPPARIIIEHRGCIRQFEVKYNGDQYPTIHGTDKGGLVRSEIILAHDEYIKGMHGYYGQYNNFKCVIRSLYFVTNKHTYGPFGQDVGTHFALLAENGRVVGFHGRADAVVNAIGVYVKKHN